MSVLDINIRPSSEGYDYGSDVVSYKLSVPQLKRLITSLKVIGTLPSSTYYLVIGGAIVYARKLTEDVRELLPAHLHMHRLKYHAVFLRFRGVSNRETPLTLQVAYSDVYDLPDHHMLEVPWPTPYGRTGQTFMRYLDGMAGLYPLTTT